MGKTFKKNNKHGNFDKWKISYVKREEKEREKNKKEVIEKYRNEDKDTSYNYFS